jgi:hypothetical protein
MPAAPDDATSEPLAVLPCSALLWASSGASTAFLLALGLRAFTRSGWTAPTLVVLALGALALTVLLADLPRRTEVRESGLDRVCLLRTEHVPWERVVAIERQRRLIGGPASGGLVARGRRGRWLLSSPAEPPLQHERLRRALGTSAPHVRLVAEPPATTTEPG